MQIRILLPALLLLATGLLPAATIENKEVFSDRMQKNIKVTVILPDGYAASQAPYPVLYLLHGHGDNDRTWVEKVPGIADLVDKSQFIVVCSNAADSWFFDSPLEPDFQYETFTTSELVNWVDANYRTIKNRSGRGITGFSMGGHGAWFLALRHPELYGAIGSISGGLDIRPGKVPDFIVQCIQRMGTKEAPEKLEPLAVMNQLDGLKDGKFAISFECGKSDFFAPCNRAFDEKLTGLGVQHEYFEEEGVHGWDYVNLAVPRQFAFFAKFFSGQAKATTGKP